MPSRPGPATGAEGSEAGLSSSRSEGLFDTATGQPLKLVADAEHDASDALLRRALAQGDREVVIQLCWNLFNQPLFRRIVAAGIPPDQAEDVLQDVFSLLHREYESVVGPELRGWLWTMTRYECLRHIKTSQRARWHRDLQTAARDQAECVASPAPPDVLAEQRDSLRAAVEFLGNLPPWETALLNSTFFEHRSDRETLEWLAVHFSRQLSLKQLVRKRHRLRERLARHVADTCSGWGKGA